MDPSRVNADHFPELVTVAELGSDEAEEVARVLRASGIDCELRRDAARPLLIDVRVEVGDEERAMAIIAASTAENDDRIDEAAVPPAASDSGAEALNPRVCANCGSTRLRRGGNTTWIVYVALLLFAIPTVTYLGYNGGVVAGIMIATIILVQLVVNERTCLDCGAQRRV